MSHYAPPMAASEAVERIWRPQAGVPGAAPVVAVAVSGGRDSMALLHCTAAVAKAEGVAVVALHVHHGLQSDADKWAIHVARACRRWSVYFSMIKLVGKPAQGQSVEAWARRGRYRALTDMARAADSDLVLLAHHRRDQAETFVLQALRGGGPAGLAAMPERAVRDGITWARPWLTQTDEAMAAYTRRHRLRFAEDPSNVDPRFARSRLRHQVMPALRAAFPDAEAAFAAAAAQSAQAQAVLAEVASADLASLCDGAALRLPPWRLLSTARRRNALQAWLREHLERGAPHALVERLMAELPKQGAAQWPCDGGTLCCHRGRLVVMPHPTSASATAALTFDGASRLTAVEEGGIPTRLLQGAHWRPRVGGERFQRAPGTPPRSLKKQFQAAGVAAWQRDALLLIAADGQLLFVPGLGVDARALALPGEPQQAVIWPVLP